MARKLFEKQAVRRRNGQLANGVALVVYTNEAGTVLADVSATSGGSALAGSTVTTADIAGLGPASLRFFGPADGTDTLYLRVPSDASLGVQKIESDPDERLDVLEAAGGGDVGVHNADTTVVHGITDTAQLAVKNAANTFTATNAFNGSTGFVGEAIFKSGRPWVDVRGYGATGDGTTDDTAAIQAAADAVEALGGGIVFAPKGTYRHDMIRRGSGVIFQGVGIDATIFKLKDSASGGSEASFVNKTFVLSTVPGGEVLWTPREDGGGYRDLTVDGNRASNPTRYGIIERPVKNVRIDRVKVKSTTLQGIMLYGRNLWVEHCIFTDTLNNPIQISDSVGFHVNYNRILDSQDFGIEIAAGYYYTGTGQPTYCGDGEVVGNVVAGCANYGIGLRGILDASSNPASQPVKNVTVAGNTVTSSASGGALQEFVRDCVVVGNNFSGNTQGFSNAVGVGAVPNRNLLAANTINSNTQNGVVVDTAEGLTISGNEVVNNGRAGISGSFVDSAILGNVVRNNGTSSGATYANVSVNATSSNLEVRGNDLKDRGSRTALSDLHIATGQTGIIHAGNAVGVGTGAWSDPEARYERFTRAGNLAVAGPFERMYFFDKPVRVTGLRASVQTAPAGSSAIVVVMLDGVDVQTITIGAGSNADGAAGLTIAVGSGSFLQYRITQIGSGTPGADLEVRVTYTPYV